MIWACRLVCEDAMIPVTSRYYGLPTGELTLPDGRIVVYLRRRFVPAGETATVVFEYPVTAADRLDLIAAKFFGDAEQFWRIADANDAMNPGDLIPPPPDGRVLAGPPPRLESPLPPGGGVCMLG